MSEEQIVYGLDYGYSDRVDAVRYALGFTISTENVVEDEWIIEVPATPWDRFKSRLPKFLQRGFLKPRYEKVDMLKQMRKFWRAEKEFRDRAMMEVLDNAFGSEGK